jgi:hypothetical protein
MNAIAGFTAGRLLWTPIRDFLKEAQFHGLSITWMESGGWLERRFTVKGPQEDLQRLMKAYNAAFRED